MSDSDGRISDRISGDLGNLFLRQLEKFLPLAFGLGIGIFLVMMFGRLPGKWIVFIVGGTVVAATMILFASFTGKTREIILFASITTLPLFYSITFGFRENVPFSVLANGFPIDLFDIGFILLLIGWIFQLWSKKEKVNLSFPRNWTILMGLMLAINFYSALYVARENFYSFSMIYGQLKCFLIAFFIANYIRDTHSIRLVGYAFAAILITQGLIVLEQLFVGVVFTDENLGRATSLKSVADLGTIYRVSGTLGHPNGMAMYLNLIIPWVGFQFAMEKYSSRKIYLGIALFLAVFAVISSGSRGGWLGIGVGSAIAAVLWYRKQGRSPVVALFFISILASLLFTILFAASNTFRTRLTAGDAGAAEVRLPLMQVAQEMILNNPLSGVGLANYTREMLSYDRTNLFISSFYNQPVHNTYLLMAAEVGLPGLLLFLAFIFGALALSYRIAKSATNEISSLGFGLMAGLISWMIHNLVNQTAPFSDSTLWFLLGLLVAGGNQFAKNKNDTKYSEPSQ